MLKFSRLLIAVALLSLGFTQVARAADGDTAYIVTYFDTNFADKDKARDDGVTPLYFAAQQGHMAVVQCLTEQGADIDKAANNGRTPLGAALMMGHHEVAAYLRAAGAK